MTITVDAVMGHLAALENEYVDLLHTQEQLVAVLKPFAFAWQNKLTPPEDWEKYYKAHLALFDIMDDSEYLKEAREAR